MLDFIGLWSIASQSKCQLSVLPDWQSWEILLNNFFFFKCDYFRIEPLDLMLL